MSEATHTPGPWSQSHRRGSDGLYSTQVFDADGQSIATLEWHAVLIEGGVRTDRAENARLIAAAPDLLAAVRRLVAAYYSADTAEGADISEYEAAISDAEAAIARATPAA